MYTTLDILQPPQEEEMFFSSPGNSAVNESVTSQPMRSHDIPNHPPLHASGLAVYDSLHTLPLSSIKEPSSPLFSDVPVVLLQLLAPHCNFLLFPNKPTFGGKITKSLIGRSTVCFLIYLLVLSFRRSSSTN